METEHRIHELVFDCGRSRRYHLYRVKLFRRFNVVRLIVSLAASSSVVVMLLKEVGGETVVLAVAAFAAGLTIIEVAVRMGRREDLHRGFAARFAVLESKAVGLGARPEEGDVAALESEYLLIESEEPPILNVLNQVCHNEEVLARYGDEEAGEHIVPIALHRRCVAWLLDVYPYKRSMDAGRV